MICKHCGETKPDYEFFKPRNKYDKAFFLDTVPDGDVCWTCGGDYKCIGCGVVQPASAFRVMGRLCYTCKDAGIHRPQSEENARNKVLTSQRA